MTEPLVPPEVDLQDFAFMPLDVQRLRDSDLASEESPEACWAAVLIWCASWHQVPAGSIPDSEQWQAKQAGYVARGKIDKGWDAIKAGALRNWIKCSDGRLYHPVVAEKALTAWKEKLAQRARTKAATEAREAKRRSANVQRDDERNVERDVSRNDGRNEQRHVERNEQRNDSRDVHQGTGTGIGIVKEEKQTATSPSPGTQVGDQPSINGLESPAEAREKRIREVATDAVETYNAAPFTKRNGGNCPNVTLVNDVRVKEVARCLKTAREISVSIGRGPLLTRDFWAAYWESVNEDPFHSGQVEGKNGHANWKPDFEYLTRKEVMTKVFDRAMSEQGTVHG